MEKSSPKLKLEEAKFKSEAMTIALKHCSANLSGKDAMTFLDSLWEQYQSESKVKVVDWLRPRLEKWFPCFDKRPKWVGKKPYPQWPWLDGRPMCFIAQMTALPGDLPTGQNISRRELFIFCAAGPALVPTPNGWTAVYEVIDQDPDFPW